jgi:hypothetical protein
MSKEPSSLIECVGLGGLIRVISADFRSRQVLKESMFMVFIFLVLLTYYPSHGMITSMQKVTIVLPCSIIDELGFTIKSINKHLQKMSCFFMTIAVLGAM